MEHAQRVADAMDAFAEAFIDAPCADVFEENVDAIIALEHALNAKATLDPAIAYAATLAHAGSHVGSSKPVDFFIHVLGLSRREAYARIRRGEHDYGDVADPIAPEQDPGSNEDIERRKEAERQARSNARQEAREQHLPAEKHRIIERELEALKPGATPTHHQLREQAVHEGAHRTPEDLRAWLRVRIDAANHALVPDQLRAMAQRNLVIAEPDIDGGCRFYGYAPGEMVALMEAALVPRSHLGALASVPASEDRRNLGQRRLDALWHVLRAFNRHAVAGNGGVASIVVSMSAKDCVEAEAGRRYATNTRAKLTPLDIIRLGAARYDYAVVLDPDSGRPLDLARTTRLASFEQKIALQASQQVCAHPGCDKPAVYCDVHHLLAWARGGYTDVENLTLLCKHHHMSNDDARSLDGGKGYADVCPTTGRVGFRTAPGPYRPGGVVCNDTIFQEESCGAKTRRQRWACEESAGRGGTDPPPGPGENCGEC